MDEIKVSIVVPVYNVEEYLPKCLDSLINQTLKDIEIICINDGSTDNSLNILESYANKDQRIKIITKKNEGQAIARNVGIKESKGEYIGFVDSDDFVDKHMFEKLYENASQNSTDITMCKISVYDNLTTKINNNVWYYALKGFTGFNKTIFNHNDTKKFTHSISVTPFNKIYKKELLIDNNCFFPENLIFEDEVFFYDVYLKAETVSLLDDFLYYYRINRKGSTVTLMGDKDFSDLVQVFKLVRNKLIETGNISLYYQTVYNRFINVIFSRYSQTSDIYKENFWKKMKKDFSTIISFDQENDEENYILSVNNVKINVRNRLMNLLKSESYEEFEKLDEKKLFSIIMPVYNSDSYLKDAINSIINQSIGFESNIQLIMVDDGSTDNSPSIIDEYQKQYPNNIKKVTQEHLGVSAARNNAFKYINSDYVTFVDSDDYISYSTLEDVYVFLQNHQDINIVKVPIKYYNRKEGRGELEDDLTEPQIFNINDDNILILHSCSVVMNTSLLNNVEFDEELNYKEDTLFISKILLKNPIIGLINTGGYFCRKHFDYSSITDSYKFNSNPLWTYENFYIKLINSTKNKGKLPTYIQNLIVYDLSQVLDNEEYNFDEEYKKPFNENVNKVLKNIDDENIINSPFLTDPILKTSYLYYKYETKKEIVSEDNVQIKINDHVVDSFKTHRIYITSFKTSEDNVIIKGFFNSLFDSDKITIKSIILKDSQEIDSYNAYKIDDEDNNDIRYLSKTWQYKYNFEVEIPCNYGYEEEIEIQFNVSYKTDTTYGEEKLIQTNTIIGNSDTKQTYKNLIMRRNNGRLFVKSRTLFSIVMAIYNSEEYLEESIDSVINQSIGFNHVQLILVNDGSTDSTQQILEKYKQLYPDNLIILNKENGGQASARNLGLNYVTGEYVNFLDSDDKLSDNALKDVHNFFNKYANKVDVVSLPLKFFGRTTGDHQLNFKFNKTRLIDLNKEPDNPQLHASSSFFRNESIKDIKFPTDIMGSEDSNFLNKILHNKKTLGVINTSSYEYRKRDSEDSTLDIMPTKELYYTPRLKGHFLNLINYYLLKDGVVPKFIQYTLAYDLQWLLMLPEVEVYDSESQIKEFLYYLNKIISYIDEDVILKGRARRITNTFMYFKNNKEKSYIVTDDDIILKTRKKGLDNLKVHNTWIDIVEISKGYLSISGFMNSLFDSDSLSFQAIKEVNDEVQVYDAKYVEYTTRENVVYMYETWQYKYNFDIKVPINPSEESKIKIRCNYHIDGDNTNFDEGNLKSFYLDIKFMGDARLSEISNYSIECSHIIVFENKTFYIYDYTYNRMKKLEEKVLEKLSKHSESKYLEAIDIRKKYMKKYVLKRYLSPKKRIVLFIDREQTADDNATHLFKYAVKQRDNFKKYFVISKESPDYKELSKYGKVVDYNSEEYKLLYLLADKIVTTHPYDTFLNPFFESFSEDNRELYNGLVNYKLYFLQHGVTKDNISQWLHKYDKNLSLILTVNDQEHDSFLDKGYNYDENIIQTLGFPRFDTLTNDINSKYILFIPTWRNKINNKNEFVNSNYYKALNEFLGSEKLIEMIEDEGYKLIFKPHPELTNFIPGTNEKYIDLLTINENIIVDTKSKYQEIFNKSALMITDYSSVFFDFAYLKRPLIYYRPTDDFNYPQNYFDYEKMGFGDIITDKEGLKNKLLYYMLNRCTMEDKYIERVNKFFKYIDNNNSKRVYEWLLKN